MKATEVDHIIDRQYLPKGSTLHYDQTNLRSLCSYCHRNKTFKGEPVHSQPSRNW